MTTEGPHRHNAAMKSMTGFGHAEFKKRGYDLQVSLKSVNGRFLEVRFHLPRELMGYESDLKKRIESQVSRGTVDIYIYRKGHLGEKKVSVLVNEKVIESWLISQKPIQALAKKKSLNLAPMTLRELMDLPHATDWFEVSSARSLEKKSLQSTFEKALSQLERARKQEGLYLKKELKGLFLQLEVLIKKMKSSREEANQLLQNRLAEKFKVLGLTLESLEQKVSQEVLLLIDKSDISEELSRLQEHVRHCRMLLESPQPEGKKLEFYTQELLRETNTVGSKSQLSKMTALVVETKTIIEKIREQVQNIE